MKTPRHRCRDFLLNIEEAIDDIGKYTNKKTYEEFAQDKTLQTLTLQSIEIIAKATRLIPSSFKAQNPIFPWKKMEALSDQIALAYLEIDTEQLYKTATKTIPPIKASIEKIKADFHNPQKVHP